MKSNRMINIKNIWISLITLLLVACEGDYLDRPLETSITEEAYWKNTQDLETFVNQFYVLLPGYGSYDMGQYYADINSDDLIPSNYNTKLSGFDITPTTGSRLNYVNIRSVNYFLEKGEALVVSETQVAVKEALLGEGFFFRAFFYYGFLTAYGGVPWIDKVLKTDSPELYSARDGRSVTVDHILADLDKAIRYLKPAGNATPFRINKEIALAFKSRVGLYEGTWEKYHNGTAFGETNGNSQKYLETAAQSAKSIMDGEYGKAYTIYSTGNPDKDYFNLFNQNDLKNNNEIIFWRKYDVGLKVAHNSQRYLGISTPGVSKSIVDSYLCINGNPISNSNGLYLGDNLPYDVFANRDPRLKQLVFVKGDPRTVENGIIIKTFDKGTIDLSGDAYCPTGYNLKKGSSPENSNKVQTTDFTSITAAILFRYAEILLNYAEAKAELGTLTQADVDLTINKIRDRVGMPHLNLSNIISDPKWAFPTLSPVINEVRRERRNELACEGFRFNDLMRWRAHNLLAGVKPLGIKFNQSDYPSLVVGKSVYVSNEGYVEPYGSVLPAGWGFKPARDYLNALTLEELSLNKSLVQNPGWN
jgi:starch-binding outer membrane protein, SusD/RagB family